MCHLWSKWQCKALDTELPFNNWNGVVYANAFKVSFQIILNMTHNKAINVISLLQFPFWRLYAT